MEADWVRAIRNNCITSAVPFFFKQWGVIKRERGGRSMTKSGIKCRYQKPLYQRIIDHHLIGCHTGSSTPAKRNTWRPLAAIRTFVSWTLKFVIVAIS